MLIDIKQIIEYSYCPMRYKYKYVDKLYTNHISILEKYDLDIHKAIYLYFLKLQNTKSVNLNILKKTWGSLWIGNKTAKDIMYQKPLSWRDTKNTKRKNGIKAIVNIHNYFKKNPGFPIVINKKYTIDISNSIKLTGNFELVRETKKNILELIVFRTNDKIDNKICIDNDLEVTSASYAFKKIFDTKEDKILYYGIDKNKKNFTSRSKDDYIIFKKSIINICKCIYNNIFYIAPEQNKCHNCLYRHICVNHLKGI